MKARPKRRARECPVCGRTGGIFIAYVRHENRRGDRGPYGHRGWTTCRETLSKRKGKKP
jgi:hypothetical protein